MYTLMVKYHYHFRECREYVKGSNVLNEQIKVHTITTSLFSLHGAVDAEIATEQSGIKNHPLSRRDRTCDTQIMITLYIPVKYFYQAPRSSLKQNSAEAKEIALHYLNIHVILCNLAVYQSFKNTYRKGL